MHPESTQRRDGQEFKEAELRGTERRNVRPEHYPQSRSYQPAQPPPQQQPPRQLPQLHVGELHGHHLRPRQQLLLEQPFYPRDDYDPYTPRAVQLQLHIKLLEEQRPRRPLEETRVHQQNEQVREDVGTIDLASRQRLRRRNAIRRQPKEHVKA
ncbi:hypothetical protein B0O80DRAFT_496996 [Mortierella sp. GBAus27b]|nr:hypothetical protein BGX31_009081 [Mortierella sp. GBA43]KAI8356278.1 hypothetical protein B0O80DRAFT_496996 [Mortierella sp. GBAus27b]